MADCVNVNTLLPDGGLSVFCVEANAAEEALKDLLASVSEDYFQDTILELVDRYGKRMVTPGDTTVASVTVNMQKKTVGIMVAGAGSETLVRTVEDACRAAGYTFSPPR
ncbi:MAG: TA0956 family protein [Candidatus Marsarchaeota archaeon]|nr:TA0956 family protein [Candidatus Marsarchaeota archaeon]